jgi:phosphatidylglycerophosphatase A
MITLMGVYSSYQVEPEWGKDDQKVVIDEVAGMAFTLLFIPISLNYIICGLILFRFFDIIKPLYIKRMELLKGGWGVMMDDVLSGIYANLILQMIVYFNIL